MASIFTRILNGEIPGRFLHKDDQCAAIADINPQAPKHFLVFPRKEIRSLDTASAADQNLLGHLMQVAAQVARQEGLAENGYRVVINTGKHGGQTVDHIHLHIIGGRQMEWPPG